jgi:hypothetical protein
MEASKRLDNGGDGFTVKEPCQIITQLVHDTRIAGTSC